MTFIPGLGRTLTFKSVWFTIAISLLAVTAFAQQPKVLAPHRPVPPLVKNPGPLRLPLVQRSMVGGLWMTDANFKSSIILRNNLKTNSLRVTPILYLGNGRKYVLKDVTLEPSGTATISVNDGLAEQGISSWATLFGYVEIQYTWAWDAMCVTVQSVDVVHSLIFTDFLKPAQSNTATHSLTQSAAQSINVSEGMWWKQEPNVSGFVGLSNISPQPIHAKLQTTDQQRNVLGEHDVVVSPHGTKLINLGELRSAGSSGGIQVSADGDQNALIINAGLQDQATGYSASMPI